MNVGVDDTPLVSVIIPTYNHARYLGNAIDSVIAQKYPNIEIIVIDNYSTDETEAKVNEYLPGKIKYLKFNNQGVIAASRNYGVNSAKGEMIAFLDSDDEWLEDKLTLQVSHLLGEGVACVATNYLTIGDGSFIYSQSKMRADTEYRDYTYQDLIIKNPVINSSTLMMKSLFQRLNGLDESPDLIALEDWELWLRASRTGKIRILTQKLVKYRIHDSNRRDKRDVHQRVRKIFERHQNLGYLNNALYRRAIGYRLLLQGQACFNVGDYAGILFYLKSLFYPVGVIARIKTLGWIIMYFLPKSLANKLIYHSTR
jgi:glycosyltransferase involved in cell wall biosynthesis